MDEGINSMVQTIKELEIENEKLKFRLSNVSNQRELLLAFSKWICNCTEYDVIPDSRIEEYLKANNCG